MALTSFVFCSFDSNLSHCGPVHMMVFKSLSKIRVRLPGWRSLRLVQLTSIRPSATAPICGCEDCAYSVSTRPKAAHSPLDATSSRS